MFDISMPGAGRIVMSGRFDASQVSKAQALFDTVEESCVIDCSGLESISSAGLGVLLGTYKRLDEKGASLKLTGMRKLVRDVFRYSRMDTIFEVE